MRPCTTRRIAGALHRKWLNRYVWRKNEWHPESPRRNDGSKPTSEK
jgi:hypothetical protein